MGVRYVPNPAFEEQVRAQPVHQKGMREITKEVARVVKVVAPNETGYYKRRVSARGTSVVAFDWAWHLIEFGSVNNAPYAPLRRGAIAAGLDFVPAPKP